MNILDVIKDCISNPNITKDYSMDELTIANTFDTYSMTNESTFTGYSEFNRTDNKISLFDQKLLRINMRVWNGIKKIIMKTVSAGNCIINYELGYFFPLNNPPTKFAYSPSLELMEKYGYTLKEDKFNIIPKNRIVYYE